MKLNKSQAMYVRLRARGYSSQDALKQVGAGPMARSRYVTFRNFTAWVRHWEEQKER